MLFARKEGALLLSLFRNPHVRICTFRLLKAQRLTPSLAVSIILAQRTNKNDGERI